MKKRHFPRGVTALLLLAMLLSASVTTAFAADTPVPCSNRDIEFYEEAPTLTSFAQTGTGEKDDDTPAWMRIDSMPNGSFIRVRIVGSNVEDHACTYSEYNSGEGDPRCSNCMRLTSRRYWVPYVRCKKGISYAISSTVFEQGYRYSSLGFQSTINPNSQHVSGFWSADSTGTDYAIPDAP